MTDTQRQWLLHVAGGVVASGAIYGLIEVFVPQGYKAEAYALVPVAAYVLGVAVPTPKGEGK